MPRLLALGRATAGSAAGSAAGLALAARWLGLAFRASLKRLLWVTNVSQAAKQQGGIWGAIKRLGLSAVGLATFARLYMLPTEVNELPRNVRLAPVW